MDSGGSHVVDGEWLLYSTHVFDVEVLPGAALVSRTLSRTYRYGQAYTHLLTRLSRCAG